MTVYYCGPCKQQFPSQQAYAQHATSAVHALSHKCTLCNRLFRSHQALLDHASDIHPTKPLPIPPASDQFSCQDCSVSFETQQGLLDHLGLIHPSCQECRKAFATQTALQQHLRDAHSGSNSDAPTQSQASHPQTSFQGTLQQRDAQSRKVVASSSGEGQQHIVKTTGKLALAPTQGTFECLDCAKRFFALGMLEAHARDAGHSKRFYCNECNIQLHSKQALSQHCSTDFAHRMRAAQGKGVPSQSLVLEPVQTKRLNQASNLCCVECDKDFQTPAALAQHRKDSPVHTRQVSSLPLKVKPVSEKPVVSGGFACRPCKKEFASQAALDQHFSNSVFHKEPDDRFVCKPCGSVFATSAELEKHKLALPSHVESLVCKECDKTFQSQPALSQHLRDGVAHKRAPIAARQQVVHKLPPVYKPSPSTTMKKVSQMMEKRLAELDLQSSVETSDAELSSWAPGVQRLSASGQEMSSGTVGADGKVHNGRREAETDVARKVDSTSSSSDMPTMESSVTGSTARQEDECIICLDARRDTLYLPCGHFCFCHACAVHTQEKGNPCPQCRTPIDLLLKVLA